MNLLESAVRAVNGLPPLPSAVLELSRLLKKKPPDADALAQIVASDPSLTAAVLRAANSAASGPKHAVTSIERAVRHVGPVAAGKVAMAAAFAGFLPSRLPFYDTPRSVFVDHCVNVGTVAELIADQLELSTSADCYTAGLLHDCGKLVMCRMSQLETSELAALADVNARWIHAERALFNTDHAVLGQALQDAWNLPEAIGTAMRWHHLPSEVPAYLDETLCVIIHLADELCHRIAGAKAHFDPEVPALLGVPDELLDDVLSRIADTVTLRGTATAA